MQLRGKVDDVLVPATASPVRLDGSAITARSSSRASRRPSRQRPRQLRGARQHSTSASRGPTTEEATCGSASRWPGPEFAGWHLYRSPEQSQNVVQHRHFQYGGRAAHGGRRTTSALSCPTHQIALKIPSVNDPA